VPRTTVKTRRRYQVVAEQIAQAIRAGEFRPSNRLPPERDLSRQCGVSRPVIREAVIALEIAGLVEVRGGSGVFVRADPAPADGVPDAGEAPYEAFLARRTIEGEIAAIAAQNATGDDLAELGTALELMRTEAERGPGPDRNDRRFHLAVAKATGSAAFVHVLLFIWDELLHPGALWTKVRARRFVRPTRMAEHEAILKSIGARDPIAARRAMHVHFDGAIRDFFERAGPVPASPAAEAAGSTAELTTDLATGGIAQGTSGT